MPLELCRRPENENELGPVDSQGLITDLGETLDFGDLPLYPALERLLDSMFFRR